MDELFRLPSASRRHPGVEGWFAAAEPLRLLAQPWFELMRHVKLRPGRAIHEAALSTLIAMAYADMRRRLGREAA